MEYGCKPPHFFRQTAARPSTARPSPRPSLSPPPLHPPTHLPRKAGWHRLEPWVRPNRSPLQPAAPKLRPWKGGGKSNLCPRVLTRRRSSHPSQIALPPFPTNPPDHRACICMPRQYTPPRFLNHICACLRCLLPATSGFISFGPGFDTAGQPLPASMGGSSVTAGVRLVVLATLATQTAALFSCFEWPSVVDPELTVRYISTDNCSHVRTNPPLCPILSNDM